MEMEEDLPIPPTNDDSPPVVQRRTSKRSVKGVPPLRLADEIKARPKREGQPRSKSIDARRRDDDDDDSEEEDTDSEDDSDEEQENNTGEKKYKIQRVLEIRIKNDGSEEFLVNWTGYRQSDNSWVGIEQLMHKGQECRQLQELREILAGRVKKLPLWYRNHLKRRAEAGLPPLAVPPRPRRTRSLAVRKATQRSDSSTRTRFDDQPFARETTSRDSNGGGESSVSPNLIDSGDSDSLVLIPVNLDGADDQSFVREMTPRESSSGSDSFVPVRGGESEDGDIGGINGGNLNEAARRRESDLDEDVVIDVVGVDDDDHSLPDARMDQIIDSVAVGRDESSSFRLSNGSPPSSLMANTRRPPPKDNMARRAKPFPGPRGSGGRRGAGGSRGSRGGQRGRPSGRGRGARGGASGLQRQQYAPRESDYESSDAEELNPQDPALNHVASSSNSQVGQDDGETSRERRDISIEVDGQEEWVEEEIGEDMDEGQVVVEEEVQEGIGEWAMVEGEGAIYDDYGQPVDHISTTNGIDNVVYFNRTCHFGNYFAPSLLSGLPESINGCLMEIWMHMLQQVVRASVSQRNTAFLLVRTLGTADEDCEGVPVWFKNIPRHPTEKETECLRFLSPKNIIPEANEKLRKLQNVLGICPNAISLNRQIQCDRCNQAPMRKDDGDHPGDDDDDNGQPPPPKRQRPRDGSVQRMNGHQQPSQRDHHQHHQNGHQQRQHAFANGDEEGGDVLVEESLHSRESSRQIMALVVHEQPLHLHYAMNGDGVEGEEFIVEEALAPLEDGLDESMERQGDAMQSNRSDDNDGECTRAEKQPLFSSPLQSRYSRGRVSISDRELEEGPVETADGELIPRHIFNAIIRGDPVFDDEGKPVERCILCGRRTYDSVLSPSHFSPLDREAFFAKLIGDEEDLDLAKYLFENDLLVLVCQRHIKGATNGNPRRSKPLKKSAKGGQQRLQHLQQPLDMEAETLRHEQHQQKQILSEFFISDQPTSSNQPNSISTSSAGAKKAGTEGNNVAQASVTISTSSGRVAISPTQTVKEFISRLHLPRKRKIDGAERQILARHIPAVAVNQPTESI